jgi:hypothetical protein
MSTDYTAVQKSLAGGGRPGDAMRDLPVGPQLLHAAHDDRR